MLTLLFLLLFFGLLGAGMPIFLVLGMCAGILYIATGQPLIGAAQMVINKLNSTTLMALPLFVMAAAFMRSGGVAKALVDVATAWLGGIRGSLGLVTVVACTLFAAICGSSVATALAMGTILVPAMIERGYPHNMEIGLVHPPVGLNLFVLSTISSAPIGEVIRGILPFLILLLIVLGIITYVPILTLWLPDAVFG
jgi:C4-dicarboxylate transporter DctM subunit